MSIKSDYEKVLSDRAVVMVLTKNKEKIIENVNEILNTPNTFRGHVVSNVSLFDHLIIECVIKMDFQSKIITGVGLKILKRTRDTIIPRGGYYLSFKEFRQIVKSHKE